MKKGVRRKKKHAEKPKKPKRSRRRESFEMSAADFEALAHALGVALIVQRVTNLASRLASPPPPPKPKAESKKKDFSIN